MAGNRIRSWLDRAMRPFRHFRDDDDLKAELQVHLELQAEDDTRPGVTAEEAHRRARLKVGPTLAVVEGVRDQEFITMLESWLKDFTFGVRSLRRNPIFTITAILTIAVGIGANTVIFTLLYGLLLRSLPVSDPEQLVRLGMVSPATTSFADVIPYRMLAQLRRQQTSFTDMAAWSARHVTVETTEGEPRMFIANFVSGNGFAVLGINPQIGRLLNDADDVRGGPSTGWPVVLSHGFWTDNYGGDPSVIGRQIRLAKTVATIVGVAPREFRGLRAGSDDALYLPMQFLNVVVGRDWINTPDSYFLCPVIARLKPGVSSEAAQAELAVYRNELLKQYVAPELRSQPRFQSAYLKVESARTGLRTFFGAVYSKPLFLMQALVGIVLLLCCVNVAGLMVSKVYARAQEFAIRTAIGAARWRLIRQYLTESFVIALAGAALGAVAAWYGTAALLPYFRHPMEGTGLSIQPDRAVFIVTGICAVLTTLLFGAAPAWRAGAANPGNLLRSRTAGGARRQILGRAFIPIQVALSFALVSIATLLSSSLIQLKTERTGFELDRVTIQSAPLNLLNLKDDVRFALYRRMKARLEESPSVHSASFTRLTPMTSFQLTDTFRSTDRGAEAPEDISMSYNEVGPGYFRTMNTTILSGREFDDNDRDQSVCIVNQSAAAALFPRQEAIGRYVRGGGESSFLKSPRPAACRVVGIAQDAKFANLNEPPPRTIYFPISVDTLPRAGNLVFLINAPSKAQAVNAYRSVKSELAPSAPFVIFVTLREQMEAALGSHSALSLMSNFFAGLALFLSGLGLYGLLSSSVAQRTGEIGVHIALGAERSRVVRMILRDALALVMAGLVVGAILLVVTVRFVDSLLYGVSAFNPLMLAAVAGVLALVAITAALVPSLRAASIDPMTALRNQ
jgi:predicted permease